MPHDSFRAESLLVVIVDLTNGPLTAVRTINAAELRRNANCLAQVCELLNVPVLLAHAPFPGHAGKPIDELGKREGWIEVGHSTNNSWETPAFVEAVAHSGRRQLVFAGIATDVGVGLTALSAQRAGYQAAVLTDVCGALSERAEKAAHMRLQQAGIALLSWTTFAAEVQRDFAQGRGGEVLRLISNSLASAYHP